MSNMPLVSVVIPCYNHERYVQECIQSVIDQTYQNIELIIIDDGSRDHSVEKINQLIEKCKNRFVRFEFRYRENKGLSKTLNEAIDWCRGKYFCAIASDDKMLPYKTELQVQFLETHTDVVAVFGGINQIDDDSQVVRTIYPKSHYYVFDEIARFEHTLPAPTQMLRLDALRKIGKYHPEIRLEDWYSYLKLTQDGSTIAVIGDIICDYRRHEKNTSKNMNLMMEKIDIIKLVTKDYDKYLGDIYLSISSDAAAFDKKKSFGYLVQSVLKEPKIIFRKRFPIVLIKNILPYGFMKENR
ncbi:Glycosyl transferase, group 2 [Mannheimia sp. USDA-ARS-USMARC-1261]|uniref:glycosyltransferase family 2 protein n=1 Tax=Mannheimia sp. USDA-ARS-USMARC-1261 TaxID=1432056 RepID=UPI0003E34160|nr:glycosyltransferase [Mannheimia sp. USDA-ARS-USMARC-1261]AHG74143.1 Glycosyl transferase, group 2 [Mannheimia sp. USDA-ARS-USMARC-1261]